MAFSVGVRPAAEPRVVDQRRSLGLHGQHEHRSSRRHDDLRGPGQVRKPVRSLQQCEPGVSVNHWRLDILGGDPLADVINTNLNLGQMQTNGFDFQVNWNPATTPYGRFALGWRGTYVINYEFQKQPSGLWINPVGTFNSPQFTDDFNSGGPVFRYRQTHAQRGHERIRAGVLTYRLASSSGTANRCRRRPRALQRQHGRPLRHLGPDWQPTRAIKGLTLRAGILNVLDEDPPYTNQVGRFEARAYETIASTTRSAAPGHWARPTSSRAIGTCQGPARETEN